MIYDAATQVSFLEHRAEVPELIDRWVGGYRRISHLPDADANEIPRIANRWGSSSRRARADVTEGSQNCNEAVFRPS